MVSTHSPCWLQDASWQEAAGTEGQSVEKSGILVPGHSLSGETALAMPRAPGEPPVSWGGSHVAPVQAAFRVDTATKGATERRVDRSSSVCYQAACGFAASGTQSALLLRNL